MLTFEAFTGINNVLPKARLSGADLVVAKDVDIGLTGEITRRGGFSEVSPDCHKNLHQGHGFMLATRGSELVSIHSGGAVHVLHPSMGPERLWYCNLPDGRTTFTNGLIHGITNGVQCLDLTVPAPESLGAVDSELGGLFPGEYRYSLAYVRLSDGLEGPAISSAPVLLGGGLRLDGLPEREGYAINVYLTAQGGEQGYLAGAATGSSFQFGGSNAELVLPCRTMGAAPLPVGILTAFWKGRLLVAVGNVLWASRPMAPHLADWRDFKPIGARITAVVPVDDGVYVGTEKDLVFLSGTTWDQLAFVPTQRGPVVPGSGVTAPGDRVKLGDGSGAGTAMLCIAGGEIVAGFGGGQTSSLTGDRYKSTATEVCATFREVNGIPQYLAIPQ